MFNKTVKKRHHIVFKNYFLQIVFLQKNITLQKQFGVGTRGPKPYIFDNHVYTKMLESSDPMYSSFFMLQNI